MARYDGTEGDDTYTSGSDPDFLYGYGGDDTIAGRAGNDTIEGGDGDDTLSGDAGDDLLIGGAGDDTLAGGDGDDLIFGYVRVPVEPYGPGNDTIDGGSGNDYIVLRGLVNTVGLAHGGIGNDTLVLSALGVGTAGSLYGDDGDDLIYGIQIAGLINGGEGTDTAIADVGYATGKAALTVDLSANWTAGEITLGDLTIRDCENLDLTFANGDDRVTVGDHPDGTIATLRLGSGADIGIGGSGIDRFYAGGGNDMIDAGGGNDWLFGEEGADTLRDGAGNDVIGGGSANSLLYGDDGDDEIVGANRNDILEGGEGNDALAGNKGRDRISGGNGDDSLGGGEQRDTLIGGAGVDEMYGDTGFGGSDRFVFDDSDTGGTIDTSDIILDFFFGQNGVVQDFVDLHRVDAISRTARDDAFVFIGTDAFSGTASELRYETSGGIVLLQGDTNGDGITNMMIRLDGNTLGIVAERDLIL